MVDFVTYLKAQPGGDIHLAGGAPLAQAMIRLGLVDEYLLYIYPVVSCGAAWFNQVEDKREMELLRVKTYANGVAAVYYQPRYGR